MENPSHLSLANSHRVIVCVCLLIEGKLDRCDSDFDCVSDSLWEYREVFTKCLRRWGANLNLPTSKPAAEGSNARSLIEALISEGLRNAWGDLRMQPVDRTE
ncbi:MAG TPA: hypothetical protein IGS17_07485 [Oscillatoriales cyanobacterium M59_W2019_021]|nr:hypothetical protein [Oscillatoriales cyanobacterium M4454_W2019_049]HIK50753.1 hypothetical protein [Oscillatoriales cyanobacterium M59_W2019_021]